MNERLIAISDIHGCFHTLQNLLKTTLYDKTTDTIVFLGDYIDRGSFSFETVSFLKALQQEVGEDNCICLCGNHEQMAMDANGTYNKHWVRNGGGTTIESYEKNGVDMAEHLQWFKSLPLIYDTPEILFCHAGLSQPLIKDNTPDDILWGRDWLRDTTAREKQVIFGHTPKTGFAYSVPSGDICIDSGCIFGGNLCALVLNDDGSSFVYEPPSIDDNIFGGRLSDKNN